MSIVSRLKIFTQERKRLLTGLAVAFLLLLPSIWFGLGHVIAKQALTVPHGCGLWESNTPTNWKVDDNWESFEPWADSDQRISMRKDFNATPWQFDSYETINFTSRDDVNLEGW